MRRGGWATLAAISEGTRGRKVFQDAKKELDGLVIVREERPYRKVRYRTRTVVYLTAKGWAACAAMNPRWHPERLAPEILHAWFAELQRERDPWALSLFEVPPKEYWKMREDVRELAELKAANRIRPHSPKKMGSPLAVKGVTPVGLAPFVKQPGHTPANKIQRSPDHYRPHVPNPAYNVPVTPATPTRTFADDLQAIQGRALATIHEPPRGFDNNPKPADVAETNRLIELFHKTDFAGRLLPDNRVEYGGEGRIISLRQWEKERLGQSQ